MKTKAYCITTGLYIDLNNECPNAISDIYEKYSKRELIFSSTKTKDKRRMVLKKRGETVFFAFYPSSIEIHFPKGVKHLRYGSQPETKEHIKVKQELENYCIENNIKFSKEEYIKELKRKPDFNLSIMSSLLEKRIVFEIQLSYLHPENLLQRNKDLVEGGYHVIWLVSSKIFHRYIEYWEEKLDLFTKHKKDKRIHSILLESNLHADSLIIHNIFSRIKEQYIQVSLGTLMKAIINDDLVFNRSTNNGEWLIKRLISH